MLCVAAASAGIRLPPLLLLAVPHTVHVHQQALETWSPAVHPGVLKAILSPDAELTLSLPVLGEDGQ